MSLVLIPVIYPLIFRLCSYPSCSRLYLANTTIVAMDISGLALGTLADVFGIICNFDFVQDIPDDAL